MSMISSVWQDLQLGYPKPEKPDTWVLAANKIIGLVGECPVCNRCINGHSWLTLAKAGNKEDMERLTESLTKKDWVMLTSIDSFVGNKNTLIAVAVHCPTGSGFTFDYIDWWEFDAPPPTKLRCFVFDPGQWQELMKLLPSTRKFTWRSLPGGSPIASINPGDDTNGPEDNCP